MTCRDEILEAATRLMRRNGEDSFSLADLIAEMKNSGTSYQESTIRTHVTSRLCANTADHHAVTYSDLERIGHGRYRIITESMDTKLDTRSSALAHKTTPPISESSPNLLAKAVRIAAVAHEHQVDKAGEAYILHPLRLMARAQTGRRADRGAPARRGRGQRLDAGGSHSGRVSVAHHGCHRSSHQPGQGKLRRLHQPCPR